MTQPNQPAVMGDSTAQDIQHELTQVGALSTSFAGVLAASSYGNAQTDYSNNTVTYVNLDPTNIKLTFTAPTSGKVILIISATLNNSGGVNWGVGQAGGVEKALRVMNSASDTNMSTRFLITGLTPNQQYTYYIWYAVGATGTAIVRGGSYAPVMMEAWAAV